MKTEESLSKKRELVNSYRQQARSSGLYFPNITDEFIKQFNCEQLEIIFDQLIETAKQIEEESPFYILSATEGIHKESGRIFEVTNFGVREESEDDVLNKASAFAYRSFVRRFRKHRH